jgi:amino acid permease
MVQSIFCIYLLLKVRNRFKSVTIIDIVDLGCTLYGEWMRPILAVLLVATNSSFLMVYIIFYGTQIDQLVCKTFEAKECGNHHMYSAFVLLALLPLIYVKSLKNIGYFSLFCLVFTLIGIIIIVVLSANIATESP